MVKVIIVIDALRAGGIRTSLLNFLNNIDYERYEVGLYAFHFEEADYRILNKNVNVFRSTNLLDTAGCTNKEIKKKGFFSFLNRRFLLIMCKIFKSDYIFSILFKSEKRNLACDIAISYTNNVNDNSLYFGSNKFVLEKVEARKKIAWLHADYEKMHLNLGIHGKEYSKFDNVIAVSNSTREKFLKYNPSLENITSVIYNFLDEKSLVSKSKEKIDYVFNKDIFNLITICRLDENKSPFMIVDICKELIKQKFVFKWHIIGDGPLYEKLVNTIKDSELAEYIEIYGFIENPYPYLYKSDLYVSTSKSEGYSLSIAEALFLKIPVVCGWYESVSEAITTNGIVVENNVDSMVKEIASIINNEDKLCSLRNSTKVKNSNIEISKEVNKILC